MLERKLISLLEPAYLDAITGEEAEFLRSSPGKKKKLDRCFSLSSNKKFLIALRELGYNLEKTNEDCLALYKRDKVIRLLTLHREATHFLTTYVNSAYDREENGKVIRGYIHPNGRTYANFKQYGTEFPQFFILVTWIIIRFFTSSVVTFISGDVEGFWNLIWITGFLFAFYYLFNFLAF